MLNFVLLIDSICQSNNCSQCAVEQNFKTEKQISEFKLDVKSLPGELIKVNIGTCYFYQDDPLPRNHIAHEVSLDTTCLLYKIIGADRLPVNSLHHQAPKEIGPELKAVGFADDGIVEVLEVPGHPFGLGVQWHPEELVTEQEISRKLFLAFVEASRNGQTGGA